MVETGEVSDLYVKPSLEDSVAALNPRRYRPSIFLATKGVETEVAERLAPG